MEVKRTDGGMDGKTDGPKFTGPFLSVSGVHKRKFNGYHPFSNNSIQHTQQNNMRKMIKDHLYRLTLLMIFLDSNSFLSFYLL